MKIFQMKTSNKSLWGCREIYQNKVFVKFFKTKNYNLKLYIRLQQNNNNYQD